MVMKNSKWRGIPRSVWFVIAAVVAAGVIGVVIQSNRSKTDNADVETPLHPLGPEDTEVLGDPNAPVLVEEYGDFQCPACKAFFDTTKPTIDELITDGTIRFAFGNFAFIGDESFRAASAALCAGDADVYWEYHDLLYENQSEVENDGFLSTDQLIDFGRQANIGGDEQAVFEQCVRDDRYIGFVRAQTDDASKRGVASTPTVFVNGERLEDRSPEGLVAAVNAAEKSAGSSTG